MRLLALLTFTTMTPIAVSAATIQTYVPGGAPCNGACTYSWALAESDAPLGEPVRMTAPAGALIVGMSYAREGEPYWTDSSMILATDQEGQGYWFQKDGQTFLMFQLDACQNWSIMTVPSFASSTPFTSPDTPALTAAPPAGGVPLFPVGPLFPIPPVPPVPPVLVFPVIPVVPVPPVVSPVPLPATGWLALLGLVALVSTRRSRHNS